jgi:hypothetical protein
LFAAQGLQRDRHYREEDLAMAAAAVADLHARETRQKLSIADMITYAVHGGDGIAHGSDVIIRDLSIGARNDSPFTITDVSVRVNLPAKLLVERSALRADEHFKEQMAMDPLVVAGDEAESGHIKSYGSMLMFGLDGIRWRRTLHEFPELMPSI